MKRISNIVFTLPQLQMHNIHCSYQLNVTHI